RKSRTSAMAADIAAVASTSAATISACIIELLKQFFQFRDIAAGEFLMLGKMRDERRDAATEETVQQALALARQPVLALQHCGVAITSAFSLAQHRALFQQAIEQGLDGWLLPIALRRQCGDN